MYVLSDPWLRLTLSTAITAIITVTGINSNIRKCDSNFHSRNECGFFGFERFLQLWNYHQTSSNAKTDFRKLKSSKNWSRMHSQNLQNAIYHGFTRCWKTAFSSFFLFFSCTYHKFESTKILESHTEKIAWFLASAFG